jgi:hypothetical protein
MDESKVLLSVVNDYWMHGMHIALTRIQIDDEDAIIERVEVLVFS